MMKIGRLKRTRTADRLIVFHPLLPMNSQVTHVYQESTSTVRSWSARVTFSNARVNEDWRKLATYTKEVY